MTKEQFIEGVSGLWHLGTTRSLTKANFPESLPSMCINLLTYKGDLVVDPFMGSGTTGVSAVKNDREFIPISEMKNYLIGNIEALLDTIIEVEEESDEQCDNN